MGEHNGRANSEIGYYRVLYITKTIMEKHAENMKQKLVPDNYLIQEKILEKKTFSKRIIQNP